MGYPNEEIINKCKKYGIIYDITERWEKGIEHHPKAKEIFNLISEADWLFGGDYFCWKSGGDGDNGEHLMYALSVLLELKGE
jgi:hypothetical protein